MFSYGLRPVKFLDSTFFNLYPLSTKISFSSLIFWQLLKSKLILHLDDEFVLFVVEVKKDLTSSCSLCPRRMPFCSMLMRGKKRR